MYAGRHTRLVFPYQAGARTPRKLASFTHASVCKLASVPHASECELASVTHASRSQLKSSGHAGLSNLVRTREYNARERS